MDWQVLTADHTVSREPLATALLGGTIRSEVDSYISVDPDSNIDPFLYWREETRRVGGYVFELFFESEFSRAILLSRPCVSSAETCVDLRDFLISFL
uniref:Uncharacterized protein n=1 Tax=Caenorhabditis japonica TaxID=281687 RepID=A0A8R1IAR8_CAEJA